MSPRKIFWKTRFFWKVNPVTVALARLFSHLMKPLQVNSLGECMNGVVHDISANQASRGWAFHTVKQINQWQWCRAVGKSVEKNPLAFCKSEEKNPPRIVLLGYFSFLLIQKGKQCRRSPWRRFPLRWPFLVSSQKWGKMNKGSFQGTAVGRGAVHDSHHWPIFLGFCESKQSVIVM